MSQLKPQNEEAQRESEEKYRRLVEASPDAMLLKDKDWVVSYINPAGLKILGATHPDQIVGRSSLEFVHPEFRAAAMDRAGRIIKYGEPAPLLEEKFIRMDGSVVEVEVTATPFSEGGKPGTQVLFRDITKRKQAEEALRASEAFLDAIIELSPHSLWVSDRAGTLIRMNQACRDLMHINDEEAVGKYNVFQDNIVEEQGLMPLIKRAFERGEKVQFTIDYDTARIRHLSPEDTTSLILETTISPVLDARKQVVHAIIQHVDITERKRAEEAQRESDQFLQQVINNAPFGAHFYHLEDDGSLILTEANKSADQILKIAHNPLIGRTIETAFPGLIGTEIPSIYRKIARNGTEYTQEQVDYEEGGVKGAFEINAFQTVPGRMAVFFADITKRKRTEAALVEEATRRRLLFEQSPDGIVIINPKTLRFLEFNTAAHQQLGYSREEFSGMSIFDVEALETEEATHARHAQLIRDGHAEFETLHRTRKGEIRNVHVKLQIVEVLGQSFYQSILRDITEYKRTEEEKNKLLVQLAHAQKMESVGRLAGGIAHDFNNMLGVIIGHSEMALDQIPPEQPLHSDLEEIRKAAQRSADLTRQLLAFARKQTATPKVLNLDDAISGMLKMLQRLIGEDINLVWTPGTDPHPVKMDPAQIDQILANLCVNARDAIAGVGKITIKLQNTTFTESDHVGFPDLVPGEYVALIMSDNGCGMSQDVLDHLFEPFYTTKEIGKGTGLGLATVYGIVKQNEGFISVDSKPGKGTEFKIYLPHAAAELDRSTAVGATKIWRSDGETVLLVEDEEALLNLGRIMLQKMGFTVLSAGDPGEAIRQAENHRGKIDMLITDVVMPEMNGRDLFARISSIEPGIKCLFMSGYTADVIAHKGVLEEGVHFIQKPFLSRDLAAKIREMLEKEEIVSRSGLKASDTETLNPQGLPQK